MSVRSTRSGIALALTAALVLAALTLSGCGVLSTQQRDASSGGATVAPDTGVASTGDLAKDAVTNEQYNSGVAVAPSSEGGGTGTDAATVPAQDRLIVRSVDMRVRVDKVDEAAAKVRSAAEKRKGMVVDYQVSTDEGVPVYRPYVEGSALSDGAALSGYITVRIPADELEAFTAEVGKLGKVLRQAENEQDVTQEHIDLAARLKNLQATETQLREFYAKAKNVTEMLAIEQELSRVRGEIESMRAQMSYLERQAAMSTVTVELTGPTPIVEPTGEDWGFVAALRQALRGFVGTINVLIVLTGTLAPVLVIALVAFYVIRAIVRRRRLRAMPAQAPAEDATVDAEE